ncbi:MAG: hypothetical protein AAFO82_20905, partial [Bacteroidota bacterium]
WTNVGRNLPGVKAGSWIPYIELSKKNAGEAFIIVNDYRRNDWRPMAFHTTDFGATFRRIVDESQVNGHALSIVQDPVEENLLWLGTDYGLYVSIDKGRTWSQWMNGFPSVSTRDLKIHPREHDLIVGTFGRAAWILDDIRPIREIARTGGKVLAQDFKVFEAPDAYQANYRSYDGIRFAANGEYIADNRGRGAMLTLWVKPEDKMTAKKEMAEVKNQKSNKKSSKKEEEGKEEMESADKEKKGKKKRPEKVKINVINSAGDTIRTYSTKVDTGMNRIYWNMRHDGVRYPSRREAKPDDNMPSGYMVKPGTYKLVFTFGEAKDSTMVNVKFDPRMDASTYDFDAIASTYEEYYDVVEAAAKGFSQLQQVKKTIGLVDKALVNAPDSTLKEIKEMGKTLKDSIKVIEKLYMQPEGMKGIQRTSDNLLSTLYNVSGYLSDMENK